MHRTKGHTLLQASEADEKDRVIAGQTFDIRYLGPREIPNSNRKGITDEAVAEIYSRYSSKAKFKSLTKKELFVSANCVSINDPNEGALLLKYSTVNVTFCNTNGTYPNAFVFVGRSAPLLPLIAHVVHCDSRGQANEIYTAMSQAFIVRCSLYQAKRIEKAGWTTDQPFQSQAEEKENTGTRNEAVDNCSEDMNNNNTFGEFACAANQPQLNGLNGRTLGHGVCGNKSIEIPNSSPSPEVNRKPSGFPLAKMLLGFQISRARSHSWHNMPNNCVENGSQGINGKRDWPNGIIHNAGKNGGKEEDDFDAFSTFAKERSLSKSLVHLVS